jgi:GDP-D-mannose dehydratase
MARSAQITVTKVHNHYYLALLPCKDARIYQASSSEMSGKVQKMPQTGNTSFSPSSPTRCRRGLDRQKNVKGEEKFFRPEGVGFLRGDSSKTKQVFGWGLKITFKELVKMMVKADVARLKPR